MSTPRILPDLTPGGLAMSEQFLDGSWRDDLGRTLYEAIAEKVGDVDARALWLAACDLVEQRTVSVHRARRLTAIEGGMA
ncbi:hypothetical protein ACFFX1_54640 [Dactylosporangium sucinum]|uniref:Uncharacterized protein n=1 Tax=Dactylosporangium sucinum TaxID=1424081 RepID=A0A917U417_9ACTN|nr:hypothetical protein [Dactylosporangium sucinum]GGM53851.1 hypothetical protein GCM10007977_064300 [Dactylosporangium sucinum]